MTKNPFGSRDPTLDADRLPETDPGFKAEGEPYPPRGLTDTWYCTSEVHTSSSPTTQGMASVRPFKSFKAWGEDKRADGHSLPLSALPKFQTGSLQMQTPKREQRNEKGASLRSESMCSGWGCGAGLRPCPLHLLSFRNASPVLPGPPNTKKFLNCI